MIRMIAACAHNRVMGAGGSLPWKIKADWDYFLDTTKDGVLIMGRRCYEDFTEYARTRQVVALSRDPEIVFPHACKASNLPDGIKLAQTMDKDVVLHAPTGAGKTFVFEQWMEGGFKGRAVYTVPTRALANDKFREWRERGWEVGLVTGDIRHRPDAPVVVATLETQRGSMAGNQPPDLFVVDEYQLLGDSQRGPGYEVTLAMAKPETALLLMSGSVANPREVAEWLVGHGRKVAVIEEARRPVPLEEVLGEALIKHSAHGEKISALAKISRWCFTVWSWPSLGICTPSQSTEELARQLLRNFQNRKC